MKDMQRVPRNCGRWSLAWGFTSGAALLTATTVGAGIFALPYVFSKAGWTTGILYLVVFSVLVVSVHFLYWQVLEKFQEKKRLLALAKTYLGSTGFGIGFLAIVGGLLLVLVVYLILGGRFLTLLFPQLSNASALILFWIFSSVPLILGRRRIVSLEFLGAILMSAIIILIFSAVFSSSRFLSAEHFDLKNLFLPFGPILFALAGWTAVEPVYESYKKSSDNGFNPIAALSVGTIFSVVLYVMFVLGIFASANVVSSDTISGLIDWPLWKKAALGVLGLFAIWTSYIPIGLEIKNSLKYDLRWKHGASLALVLFLPLLLIYIGLGNFLKVVSLTGGVFLSLQYLLIILVGRRVLILSTPRKLFFKLVSLVFILAAVYEIYYFVINPHV